MSIRNVDHNLASIHKGFPAACVSSGIRHILWVESWRGECPQAVLWRRYGMAETRGRGQIMRKLKIIK